MKNKLFADALIVIVLSMLPGSLVAADASVNRPTAQKLSNKRTCEHSLQLIPMLMGHTNLAQFALLALQFPEEALDPIKPERVIQIDGTPQSLKINLPSFNRAEGMCGGMRRLPPCHPPVLHAISL